MAKYRANGTFLNVKNNIHCTNRDRNIKPISGMKTAVLLCITVPHTKQQVVTTKIIHSVCILVTEILTKAIFRNRQIDTKII